VGGCVGGGFAGGGFAGGGFAVVGALRCVWLVGSFAGVWVSGRFQYKSSSGSALYDARPAPTSLGVVSHLACPKCLLLPPPTRLMARPDSERTLLLLPILHYFQQHRTHHPKPKTESSGHSVRTPVKRQHRQKANSVPLQFRKNRVTMFCPISCRSVSAQSLHFTLLPYHFQDPRPTSPEKVNSGVSVPA